MALGGTCTAAFGSRHGEEPVAAGPGVGIRDQQLWQWQQQRLRELFFQLQRHVLRVSASICFFRNRKTCLPKSDPVASAGATDPGVRHC